MTPETLRKLADEIAIHLKSHPQLDDESPGSWDQGRASAFREVAAMLEAEQAASSKLDPATFETAAKHKRADARCGRSWVCSCAACRMVRSAR